MVLALFLLVWVWLEVRALVVYTVSKGYTICKDSRLGPYWGPWFDFDLTAEIPSQGHHKALTKVHRA